MDIPPARRWLTRERKCSSSLCKQSPYRSCLPNEKRVTNIQNPSQTGLRTQGDGHFRTHGAAVAISTTAAGEESSAIRAIAECAVGGALRFIYQATPLFLELRSRDEVVCGGADGATIFVLCAGSATVMTRTWSSQPASKAWCDSYFVAVWIFHTRWQ